jgi:hypothetical protein
VNWHALTDNCKYVISTRSFPSYNSSTHDIDTAWETLVCPADRNSEPILERSVVSRRYIGEDEAFLGHLNLYTEWNSK